MGINRAQIRLDPLEPFALELAYWLTKELRAI